MLKILSNCTQPVALPCYLPLIWSSVWYIKLHRLLYIIHINQHNSITVSLTDSQLSNKINCLIIQNISLSLITLFCLWSSWHLEFSALHQIKMLQINRTSHTSADCEAALTKLPMGIEIKRTKQLNESIETIDKIVPISVLLKNFNPNNTIPSEAASRMSIVSKRSNNMNIQNTIKDISKQHKASRRTSIVEASNDNKHRQHQSDRRHKCNLCNKTFSGSHALSVHKSTHYQNEKSIECGFCQKKFHEIKQLRRHEKHQHKSQTIGCKYCDKTFDQSFDNIIHIRAEHFDLLRKQDKMTGNLNALFQGIRTYECFKCGYSTDFHNLQKHIAQCQRRYYECSFCTKQFRWLSVLRKHENIHNRTQNDNTKTAVKVIGAASITKTEPQTKRRSIRISKQTKPVDVSTRPVGDAISDVPVASQNKHIMASKRFKCDHCPIELHTENELRAHKRVHNKATIECGQCNFKCQLNIILSKHMRTMHSIGSNMEVTIYISDDDE